MKSKLRLENDGRFQISNVTDLSHTYFPLCNAKAMKSAIAPSLGGDAKVDQNSFLLVPATVEDLAHSLFKRHVFFRVDDRYTWSTSGQTAHQTLTPDTVDLYGDFLTHTILRKNDDFSCAIESFVPSHDHDQELHKITVTNTSDKALKLKAVVGIPIYSRSADSVRDHRHVTALLNRVKIYEHGLINHPTFSFDERGHILNQRHYGVFAHNNRNLSIAGHYPSLEDFNGEGHSLLDPLVVKEDVPSLHRVGDVVEGYETIAGLAHEPITLEPDASVSFVVTLAIDDDEEALLESSSTVDVDRFDALKKETLEYWKKELSTLAFKFTDAALNGWLKWVTLQPILRRIYGNSFLPHHDYGRGGRGWRDLWQDLLGLILMNPAPVKAMILNNFKGVRIDGSNATIIGDKPGEFIADRNNIPRTWMDHGCWPLLTTKLYLDQSGDVSMLFEKATYFQDQFTHYTKQANTAFDATNPVLKTHQGTPYEGTVLEHILVQNLVPYYNVGAHGNIRLEGADWNDGMDMAPERGESVAFTAFYGQNLITLSALLTKLHAQGIEEIALFEEFSLLLKDRQIDDVQTKQRLLTQYFDTVKSGVSGKQTHHHTHELATLLARKGEALLRQVRDHEWMETDEDGWFNGYYDNDGNRLEDVTKKHMTLTGQVFAIMSHAATDAQVEKTVASADKYLFDRSVGGYRLNTNFNEVKTNMGRLFGFAYGHKENGAMFSHMAVMYANALYKRGFVAAGHKVLNTIYTHSMDLKHSKMYPGIPEYFDPKGRGMYAYLTGSASWMILTMVTEVFGVKSDLGYPVFEPKLMSEQFGDATELGLRTIIGHGPVEVVYRNPKRLTYGEYKVAEVVVDGQTVSFTRTPDGVKLNEKITGDRVVILLTSTSD